MKYQMIFPTLVLFATIKAFSQTPCPVDEAFPYDFCKDGQVVHRCASDPWHVEEDGVHLIPLRRSIPGCIQIEQRNTLDIYLRGIVTGGPNDLVPVFISANQDADVRDAFAQWTSLCPPSGTPDCCAKVYFSTNPLDFENPNEAGHSYVDYNTKTCKPTCAGSNRIMINSTPSWYYRNAAPNPSSDIVRSFFTGRYAPSVAPEISAISFYQTMEVLSGAWLGMRAGRKSPETAGCDHPYSVMSQSLQGNPINLTDADKCQFRKLYCDHAVGLDVPEEEAAAGFTLSQNVPNPFNAMTTIPYTLRKAGTVRLVILDAMGKEVKSLVDQKMQPGSYTYGFRVDDDISSGHYWYILEVDGVTVAKQMIVVK